MTKPGIWLMAAGGVVLVFAGPAWSQVWTSTFDGSADGVVDLIDNSGVKVMIGGVTAGRLTITAADVSPGQLDKAGRPLGATLTGNNNFSALIKFRYSFITAGSTPSWSAMGFMGKALSDAQGACCNADNTCTDSRVAIDCTNGGGTWQGPGSDCGSVSCPSANVEDAPNINSNRQFVGAVLRHTQVGGVYFLIPGLLFGGSSHNGFLGGPQVSLGTDPFNTTYTLAICYNGALNTLRIVMTDEEGNRLVNMSGNLSNVVTGSGGFAPQKASLRVDHLGFSDYIGSQGNRVTVYEIDEMSYYRDQDVPLPTANAACNALPAEPTGLCCDSLLPDCNDTTLNTFFTCEVSPPAGSLRGDGTFHPGENCGSFSCPTPPTGACCQRDGTCQDDLSFVACSDGADPEDPSDDGNYQGNGVTCEDVAAAGGCPEPGACCLIVDGVCVDNLTQSECETPGRNEGVWQGSGSLCGTTTCPPPATGACCADDFTCMVTTLADCTGGWCGPGTDCSGTPCRSPAPTGFVWMEEFDVDQGPLELLSGDCHEINPGFGDGYEVCWDGVDGDGDGLVDCDDNTCQGNEGTTGCCVEFKPMFGAVANSKVRVEVIENRETTAFVPDRGGRPLDTPLEGGTESFSVLYQFVWEDLPDGTASDYAAFMGKTWSATDPRVVPHQSRQTTGTNMIHSVDANGNFLLNLVLEMGGVGVGLPNVGRKNPGALTNLGPYAEGCYYQLAMGYFAPTHTFTSKLYDANSNLLAENSSPIEELFTSNGAGEIDRQYYTHVGWLDYTGFGSVTRSTVWQLDRLVFWNDAFSAFPDGPPSGACCLPDATCLDDQSLADCADAGGTFQGPNSLCADVDCPLPPCNDPVFDVEPRPAGDGDVDSSDFAELQLCYTALTGSTPVGVDLVNCHCFDSDVDNDIDIEDLLDFLDCSSGPDIPADPGCDD